jgi:hypothetical protein
MRRHALLALALAAALGTSGETAAPAASPGAAAPGRIPAARAAHLEAELAAAESHRLYLVLDPWTRRLDLKADGVVLRRFVAEGALWGQPRLAGGAAAWPAAVFSLRTEIAEPDRPRIPVGAPSKGVALTEAERRRDELLSQAPTHYRLRFEPALDLSIRGETGIEVLPRRLSSLRHLVLEGWENAALTLLRRPLPPRVVLTLRPEEAQRLFLALQPEMQLLVKAP